VAEARESKRRGSDEQRTRKRRAQGSTVAALNAFSAAVDTRRRRDLRFQEPDDAIAALADELAAGNLHVPRLLVLDSLVRLAHRRGSALDAHDAALDRLLEQLVRDAQVPEAEVGGAVSTVRAALGSVASLSNVPAAPHPWHVFVQRAGRALRLSRAEIEKPLCNDRQVVVKGPHEAVGVTVEFHTDASPGELRRFCDPRCWHECSPYQREMTEWTGPGARPVEDRAPAGWRRDLLETVELSPGKMLETPLRFTHTIQDPDDPSWVHLDYVMIGETDDICVDEGALDVRRVATGRHAGRTRVTAKKAILFKDELLRDWPTVACDTFWMSLVIDAAVGCLGPGATLESKLGELTMADSKEVPLTEVIEGATAAAHRSINAYERLANEAADQLTGDSPAEADKWVQLSTRAWAQAARDAAQAWTTYVGLLQAIAGSGEEEGGQSAPGSTDESDSESEGNGTNT
jgi:hypothetical protein